MPTISGRTWVRNRTLGLNLTSGTVHTNTDTRNPYGAGTTRVTVNDPLWRTKIAKHQDAGNSYRNETEKFKPAVATCFTDGFGPWKGVQGSCEYKGMGTLNTWPQNIVWNAVLDGALQKLKRKMKKRVGGAEALVPVLESREMSKVVRQMTKMTTTLVETLIDIKRTKGRSAFEYASSAWLTYGFGVAPLVEDTKNIAKAIGSYLDRGDSSFRESAVASGTWIYHDSVGPSTGTVGADLMFKSELEYYVSYRYYCGGYISVTSGNDYGLAEHLGLEGRKMVPAMWELIPFSWVVDYFTTTGAYLEDVFHVLPGNTVYSGITRRATCTVHTQIYFKPWSNFRLNQTVGTSKYERFEFERYPLQGSLPHVSLRWKTIDEVGYFGVTKLLNLASVLIQRR